MPKVQASFYDGRIYQGPPIEVSALIESVTEARQRFQRWPVDRIIDILDAFAVGLLERDNPLHRRFPGSGLPYIASWAQRASLERMLDSSLHDRACLDDFLVSSARSDRAFAAFPRGTVLHWMAGNVPTLGFLSMLQGMLTKNANVVKVASNQDDMLDALLDSISQICDQRGDGAADLMKAVAVLRFSRAEKAIAAALSQQADVRVLWGGDDALASVRRLPAKLETVDVVFPNRTSLIIIGASALKGADLSRLARRIAMDVSIFEQKACASPHTVFLETSDEQQLDAFAAHLLDGLKVALRALPKTVPSQKEVAAILNLRAQYDMFHKAWYSKGTEYTILSDDELKLGPAIGNRTLYLRRVDDLEKVAEMIEPQVQSVGIAAEGGQFDRLTRLLGARGVHRFVPAGNMTHFEMPWDGYFLAQNIVRWTSRPVPRERLEARGG